jgi:acetyl-CoA carboxylase biotin carboxyl carrier protein
MDQLRIKELIDLLADSDLTELTLSEGGSTLTLTRDSTPTSAAPASTFAVATPAPVEPMKQQAALKAATPPVNPQASTASSDVCSPLYGILHLTPSPDEPPFIAVGDRVVEGQTLCIVEAMKMFHQVRASKAGRVDAILAEAGNEVESGQPLFRIV